MSYTSLSYYVMTAVLLVIYYLIAGKYQWVVLLAGSALFYISISGRLLEPAVFAMTIALSWLMGLLLEKKKSRWMLALSIILSAMPLILSRIVGLMDEQAVSSSLLRFLPIGISFYSLQIISYLADLYKGTISAEKNILKYALFVSFFPQIVEGPIPRYGALAPQLYEHHSYSRKNLMEGMQLILWGFFLKYMIADKAAIAVNTVFDHPDLYRGAYAWLAGILYSFQLYADFSACTCMSIGAAGMFGIQLSENFDHPYFSRSVPEFWRRWHISLSNWLRDYIYIPLGGNRKGKKRRIFNLLVTFAVSGLWHGIGLKYLVWGLIHGFYVAMSTITKPFRSRMCEKLHIERDTSSHHLLQILITFFFVMTAWIIFRADSLHDGFALILSMFTVFNPEALRTSSLMQLGLDSHEWMILILSLIMLLHVSKKQQKVRIRSWLAEQNIVIRWILLIGMVVVIWVFGTYGFGYNSADFIYGAF